MVTFVPIVACAWGYAATDPAAVWTDVTPWVDVVRGLSLTRGASDELSQVQPGTLGMVLDNSDGRFTPGLATSPYWPHVRRGTPIRAALAVLDEPTGTAPYPLAELADDFDDGVIDTARWSGNAGAVQEAAGVARIPAAAGATAGFVSARQWTLTGSQTTLRLLAVPAATGATTAIFEAMVTSATPGTRAGFQVDTVTGNLSCRSDVALADAGAVVVSYDSVAHAWLRIREDAGSVYWETSPDGVTWTVQRTAATPAWVGTDQVALQLSAHRDAGVTDYAEVDLVGARVFPRFYGTVTSWPFSWAGLSSAVTVTATDLFAWLSRQPSLQPMLIEEVLLDKPQAYYPLSEPDGSTSAGDVSGYTRPALATVQAGTGGTLTFGQGVGPAADGLPAPLFTPASASAGLYLYTDLATRLTSEGNPGTFLFEAWFSTSTKGRVIVSWATSDPAAFEDSITFSLDASTGHLVIEQVIGGGLTSTTLPTANLADGQTHQLIYDESLQTAYVDDAGFGVILTPAGSLRRLTVGAKDASRLWSGSISHVALYVNRGSGPDASDITGHYSAGTDGFDAEDSYSRIFRLAAYAGIPNVILQGENLGSIAGQGQLGSTALSHMQDVEMTESARLFCDRASPSIVWQTRTVRYNPVSALTLAYADLETADVQYADDDQKMVNRVLASRPGGATQLVLDQSSIDQFGPYEKQLDILKTSDAAVLDPATWHVTRYADPDPELRQVPVEASTLPAATYRALLAADISTVITVTDLPDQAPASTVPAMVEGYTETITQARHVINFRTSSGAIDSVWVLDDPTYSVLGTSTRLAY